MNKAIGLKVKRLLDIVGSLVLLVLLSPVLLAVALLVKINIGGSVLYHSPRVGYQAKIFNTLKFRSMKDLFDINGKLLPDEQRLNRFSKILRATSLDELPQLVNILRGEMSMIGPRPALAEFLPYFKPEEMRRFDMLPGITGWAQVNGRNYLQWDERLEMDVNYVDNWSLAFDIKIAWMTLPVWLKAQGISMPGFATCVRLDELRKDMHKPEAAPSVATATTSAPANALSDS